MARLTQLITAIFRRKIATVATQSPAPQCISENQVAMDLDHNPRRDWTITCPHCHAKSTTTSDSIESQLTCESCGKDFEPFSDALPLKVSRGISWAMEETLQSLYLHSSMSLQPTADWKPSVSIEESCPHCHTRLRGRVRLYQLHRCPSCQGVFCPVLEAVGVRSKHTLERFGRFPILETLGQGGMGIVYKAHHPQRNCPFALKVILNQEDWSDVSRFYREGETIARLKHPHIVKIHEIGQYGGTPYLALEYLGGGSLRDRLKQGKLSVKPTLSLAVTLARTLDFAHERGVIHRDLKPANILLTEDGTPKISDFGLVKRLRGPTELEGATISLPSWYGFLVKVASQSSLRTGSLSAPHPDALSDIGLVLGTPAYMAPEQAEGDSEEVGPAADIFAFGVMVYQMLTGHLPFPGQTRWDFLQQIRTVAPLPPSAWSIQVPKSLDAIVLKCLDKTPKDRFGSAGVLAEALERIELG